MLAVDWKGDLSVMEKELTQVPDQVSDPDGLVTFARMQLLLLQRKFHGRSRTSKAIASRCLITMISQENFFEGAIHTFSRR